MVIFFLCHHDISSCNVFCQWFGEMNDTLVRLTSWNIKKKKTTMTTFEMFHPNLLTSSVYGNYVSMSSSTLNVWVVNF